MKARVYAFDEVDRPEEVAKALTDLRQETINEINALQTEMEGCQRVKPSRKKRGFAMKNVLVSIAVLSVLLGSVVYGQFAKSDLNYDVVSNPQQLTTWLTDVVGAGTYEFTPIAAPTNNDIIEGKMYYDITAQAMYYSNDGSTWTAFDAGSAVSLDGAYNVGSKITVDTGVVELEAADSLGVAALLIDYDDATTNAMDAVQITNAGNDGAAVSIQIDGTAGFDIQGTSDTWNVTIAGVANLVGLVTTTGDVTFTGANYDIIHDASADQLEFQDAAKLSFGTDDDISIAFDNAGDDLNILADDSEISWGVDGAGMDSIFHLETASTYVMVDEDADELLLVLADLKISQGSQIEFIDATDSLTDWTIDNATDETLLIYPTETDGTQSINLGNATNTTDLRIFGETASTVVYDATANIVIHTDYNVNLTDADELRFGTGASGGAGDFKISGAATPTLLIDAVVDGTGEIEIGNTADDLPMKWFTDTSGDWVYFNDDEVEFEDCVLILMDATQLQFGDSADFYIHATNTAATLGTLTTDETSAWNFGSDENGADVKFFGTTAGDLLLWDASADYLHMIGDSVLLTLAEAGNQFKVDATGTVVGDAINLDTTDGGIMLDADGGANGDIEANAADDIMLTAADDMTVTAGGDLTLAVTGSVKGNIYGDGSDIVKGYLRPVFIQTDADETLTIAQSGTIFYNDAGVAGIWTLTLPDAQAGLFYTVVDISAVAADDVHIDPQGGDKIDQDAAGDGLSNTADEAIAAINLFCVDGVNWVTTGATGTWAAD